MDRLSVFKIIASDFGVLTLGLAQQDTAALSAFIEMEIVEHTERILNLFRLLYQD